MKLIYMASYDLKNQANGVVKKIKIQIKQFESYGIEVNFKSMHTENKILKILSNIPLFPHYMLLKSIKLISKKEILETDVIYIRKMNINLFYILLLLRIKKINKNLKIIMEIPTYPYTLERKGIFSMILNKREQIVLPLLKIFIDRIVTYSKDEKIYGIKTIKLSNAIDIKKIKVKNEYKKNQEINLIAVAMFSFWHGYDRIIKGLANYYNNEEKIKVKLNLVGEGKEIIVYKKLVQNLLLEDVVIFHGEKFGEELDEVYNKADIALDAMARHRVGVNYNSSLKGKEYGAKGLPIISGVLTELDDIKNYKYYLRVDSNDSEIDIKKIVKFYNKVYKEGETSKQIIDNIRKTTEEMFDISVTSMPLLKYIKQKK